MSAKLLLGAIAALAALPAQATVLNFNISGATDGSAIPTAYGNRVSSASSGAFSYGNQGEGFTPGIAVSYGFAASFWSSGYGALTNVAYADGSQFSLTLTADAGLFVSLSSFRMAGFDNSYQINGVSVTGGSTSFAQSNVVINGSSNGTGLTTFSFGAPIVGSSLTISFNSTNLGAAFQANVGIDNIVFAQVPEPSVLAAALAGVGGLGLVLRRRRA